MRVGGGESDRRIVTSVPFAPMVAGNKDMAGVSQGMLWNAEFELLASDKER
jgi:hypothetical protein